MLVWIVNPFDNLPSEGYRPQRYWLMARAFAAAGCEVVYWTSDFSHASKRRRVLLSEPREQGISLRLVKTVPYPGNICLRRVFSHWRLAKDWARAAAAEPASPDVVVASTPPLTLCGAAQRFAKRCGALFVADIMDAWPETFERIAPSWALLPMRRAARRIYNGANAISAVATRYIALAKSYGATAPIKLSYHGIALGETPLPKTRNDGSGMVRLAYIGAMGASYDLETAIAAVKSSPSISLDLAGSGPKEAALRAQASDCSRIRFHGYLAETEVKELLSSCDAGLVPMFPDSCVGVPYKLADYAAAGLPVVECLGGETGEIAERFGCGVHYRAGDAGSLAAALAKLPLPRRDSAGFARFFDARRIMSEYVAWIEGMLKERE